MIITPQQSQVPQGRAFKYQFDLEIHRVSMHIPIRCFVELSWRRGNKSIQTKNKIEIQGHETEFRVDEKLSMISTCYFDEVSRKFTEKNSNINLVLYINNIPKAGGSCPVDLSQILNPLNYKECYSKTIDASLIKCPISLTGKISFSLVGVYLQQMLSGDDNRSIGSGVSGISSSVMNYSDSNFSLYFNKKNTVSEVPSKDFLAGIDRNERNIDNSRNSSKKSDDGFRETKRKIQCISQFSQQSNNMINTTPVTIATTNTTTTVNALNMLNGNSENATGGSKMAALSKKKLERTQENYYQIKKQNGPAWVSTQTNKEKMSLKELKDQKLREEKFRLQSENVQLRVYVEQQTKKINDLIKDNLGLKQQQKNFAQRQEKFEKINRELENQNIKNRNELQMLQMKIAEVIQNKDEAQALLTGCEKELARVKKEMQDLQLNTNTEYQTKINHLQNLITKQMKEIEIKIIEKDKYESLKMEYDNIKNKFERSEIEKNRIVEHYQREAYAHNFKFNEMNNAHLSKIAEKQNFIDTIKREFQKTYTEKNDLLRIRDDLNLQIVELQGKIQVILNENQKFQKMIQNNQMNEKNQERLKSMTAEYKNLQKALVNNNEKMKLKQKEISEKEDSLKSKDEFLKLRIIENQDLERKLVISSEQINEKIDQIKNFQLLVTQLKAEIEILKQQLTHTKRKEDLRQMELQNISQENISKQNEILKLLDEYNQVKQELKDICSKYGKLIKDYEYCKCMLNECQSQFQKQMEDMKNNLSEQNKTLKTLTRENTTYHTKVQNINNQNKQLQENYLLTERRLREYQIIMQQQSQQLTLLNEIIQKHQEDKTRSQDQHNRNEELLKQNIRLQIELKVISDQLKLQNNHSEQIVNLQNKLEIQLQNNRQYQEQIQKLEKEKKDKYKAMIIETQKNKIYFQEKNAYLQALNERTYQYDLEKQKTEILEKNIKEIQIRLEEQIKKSRDLQTSVRNLNNELYRRQEKSEEIKMLQKRNKELENRQSEKILILQELNKNLYKSNEAIKQLHKTIENKNREVINREKIINQLEGRLINNQELKKKSIQLSGIINEKKNIQKKNELLFNEICVLRQRCDENAKNLTHATNNQQLVQKINQLENQLYKRQQKLKKLQKQNNKLQEQNIQLNIKIMKQLTEIQKKQEGIKIQYSKSLNKVLSDSQF